MELTHKGFYKRGHLFLTTALIACLLLCACSERNGNVQSELVAPPAQGTEHPMADSANENPCELPNGWHLNDFTIVGFDKEGPGDFGHRITLDEEQHLRLTELLDVESWQEMTLPIEHGLSVALTAADENIERFLAVMDGGDLGTVISLWEGGSSEKQVYTAPAQVVQDAKALSDELKKQVEKS